MKDCHDKDVESWPYHAALLHSRRDFERFRTVPIGLDSGRHIVLKELENLDELVRASVQDETSQSSSLERESSTLERSMKAM